MLAEEAAQPNTAFSRVCCRQPPPGIESPRRDTMNKSSKLSRSPLCGVNCKLCLPLKNFELFKLSVRSRLRAKSPNRDLLAFGARILLSPSRLIHCPANAIQYFLSRQQTSLRKLTLVELSRVCSAKYISLCLALLTRTGGAKFRWIERVIVANLL